MPLTLEEHVLGCLLGSAIGDALGNPIEFSSLIGSDRARAGRADHDDRHGHHRRHPDDPASPPKG